MLSVAYLANQFPSAVEQYVAAEIEELRSHGVRVIAGSVRRSTNDPKHAAQIVLQPLSVLLLLQGAWLCLKKWNRISPLISRVLLRGKEGPFRRLKALTHTWLGACYAVKLRRRRIDHIHAHHGYFGSWIAMVAARLTGASFSMTLHGSDLLLHGAYLEAKLANCAVCFTVSEYNRQYLLECYPNIDPRKIVLSRLGVDVAEGTIRPSTWQQIEGASLTLLAVGRLHKVKDHAFLVRACAELREQGVNFECSIAGEGAERRKLESLIHKLGLEKHITLLGHVAREQMDSLYDRADVVALTSRSEGIPLMLMEAMARGKIVLAPAITGIPELVLHRKTGFLYEPGSMEDFVRRILFIHSLIQIEKFGPAKNISRLQLSCVTKELDWVRHAARVQVLHNFHCKTNLKLFGDLFISRIATRSERLPHENPVLQQIQLPLQRDRSLPVRIDGTDAEAETRSSAVLHG